MNFFSYFSVPFGPRESQTVKQLRMNVAIWIENQNLQQSLIETNAQAINIM